MFTFTFFEKRREYKTGSKTTWKVVTKTQTLNEKKKREEGEGGEGRSGS